MPIYEYVCSKCGKRNEILQKFSDPTPEQCDSCGARKTLHRVVSRSSFQLRGGGWYSDLYASTKKPASDSQVDAKEQKDAKESKDSKGKDSTPPKEPKKESKKPAGDSPPASSPAKSASPSPSTSTPPKKNEKAG